MPRYGHKPRQQFKPVDAGMHVAWLVQFIDLGTHLDRSPQYGDKYKRKARFVWALPDMLMENGQPMTQGATVVLSPHEKARFRKMCQSWMGKIFSDAQFLNWDERELFNVPCMLNVVHKDGEDGPYAVVQDVMPLMRGMQANQLPENYPFIYLSLDPSAFDRAEYNKLQTILSERQVASILEQIESSPEWETLTDPNAGASDTQDDNWQTDDPLPEAEPEPAPQPPARAPQPQPRMATQASAQQARQPAQAPAQAARTPQAQTMQRASGPAPGRPAAGPNSASARATQPSRGPAVGNGRVSRSDPDLTDDHIPF